MLDLELILLIFLTLFNLILTGIVVVGILVVQKAYTEIVKYRILDSNGGGHAH